MKKVRFQSPKKFYTRMNEFECHSPRPFIDRPFEGIAPAFSYERTRILPYSPDPLDRYEQSNSIPIAAVKRTDFGYSSNTVSKCLPSNDLELSMLDGSSLEPRKPVFPMPVRTHSDVQGYGALSPSIVQCAEEKPMEEKENSKPVKTVLQDNSFFIKRDNLGHFVPSHINNKFQMLKLDKENNPFISKMEMMHARAETSKPVENMETKSQFCQTPELNISSIDGGDCSCHHCKIVMQRKMSSLANAHKEVLRPCNNINKQVCQYSELPHFQQMQLPPVYYSPKTCNCDCKTETDKPKNAVDKKTWALEKYGKQDNTQNLEVEKQSNVSKEKREPTVADLFKIIKLQNEQLQLLQEKVDKFISVSDSQSKNNVANQPLQPQITNIPNHTSSDTVNTEQKMSIGVMTSFEVVCTSTVINKEIIKTTDSAQIQCNRSQISIKEVVSKKPMNQNFLDGLRPSENTTTSAGQQNKNKEVNISMAQGEEKTFNEQSLFNVQVDNATTPLMSPEQTLYLDVRDYSDSDSGSDNQSNVGWTYYNKVMTHVNGMLQDSDMPSSASALYRNMRQQCMQMHIDKTNVSVTKRVKFGEDVLMTHPIHSDSPASSDASFKMNQLAAKYLKDAASPFTVQQPTTKPILSTDMSLATKNYMERHQLIRGQGNSAKATYTGNMPRFLDITALKQQPKLL